MTDREDSAEFSEETRRLIDDLGRRMSDEAGQGGSGLVARMSSSVDANTEREPALEEKLGDLEAEIDEARQELRRLQEMRGYLLEQLGVADDRSFGLGSAPAQRARMRRPAAPATSDYLDPVVAAVRRRRSGSFWLHGDDARERLRAIGVVAALLHSGRREEWVVAEVDFTDGRGGRPTSAPHAGAMLAHAVRTAWDSWDDERRPLFDLLPRSKPVLGQQRMGAALAVILSEFPSRRRQAAPFLSWLAEELQLGGPPLLIVSADRPPLPGQECEEVLCESRQARLGRRVATLRLQKGWNRARLAEAIGIPQADLTSVESGLTEGIDRRIIRLLARALEVSETEIEGS